MPRKRPVQGKIAAMQGCVFSDVLDMSFYTSCPGFGASSPLRLPHDQPSVDLSVTLFRRVRLVGGGWTESINVDPQLMSVARHLYERNILASPRTCPLCRALAGTPWHVIMSCSVMKPLVDLLRDVLEQLNAHGLMLRLAHVWHSDVQARGLGTIIGSVAPEVQARWPLLSAWRWLVPTLDREVILSADTGGHSAAAVCAEGECDLAHRVLPAALGRAILQAARGTPVPHDALPDAAEGFVHLPSSAQLAAEQARHRSLVDRLRPAIDFTAVLLCGLRAARWQYSARTGLVASCCAPCKRARRRSPSQQWQVSLWVSPLRWRATRRGAHPLAGLSPFVP